ncbi:hypothetical protein GGR08_000600 [Bartonella fuyuanensis]|uniref:Uncharacterized protein n=1 Tax=Bartonella fuyuanensis TaxID=1460968 RepID=A0A840E079_9HYPH|nr:hypothetical protein [Bartonella fuyuanensis]
MGISFAASKGSSGTLLEASSNALKISSVFASNNFGCISSGADISAPFSLDISGVVSTGSSFSLGLKGARLSIRPSPI